jgi:hypothetical protein
MLKNVRNGDLVLLYKKIKLQLIIIITKGQFMSFIMWLACFGQEIHQILMLLSLAGLG